MASRTPGPDIRRLLRKEVGFGCPVTNCGNPYLTWHHFDPPWRTNKRHDPSGMIALCRMHHDQADNGAFTADQLRALKTRRQLVASGSFSWRRLQMLAIVGGNVFLDVPVLVSYRGNPIIWFTRDEAGGLALSIRMLTASSEGRLCLNENDWIATGVPTDLECPPSGKLLKVAYSNGDVLSVRFHQLTKPADVAVWHAGLTAARWLDEVSFPIAGVEVVLRVGGTPIILEKDRISTGQSLVLSSNFFQDFAFPAVSIVRPEDALRREFAGGIRVFVPPGTPTLKLAS